MKNTRSESPTGPDGTAEQRSRGASRQGREHRRSPFENRKTTIFIVKTAVLLVQCGKIAFPGPPNRGPEKPASGFVGNGRAAE